MSVFNPIQFTPEQARQVENHLLDHVARTASGCWEWQRCRVESGYGKVNIDKVLYRVHRVSYVLFCGPIPDGLYVCHRCDNPPCCNPTHLFLGTNSENMRDCVGKGRFEKGGRCCPPLNRSWGEKCSLSKLTAEQVKSIRAEYIPYVVTYKMLARKYGVHPETILNVVTRKKWAQLA